MAHSHPLLIDIGQGLYRMIGLPAIDSWKTNERPINAKSGTFGFNIETNRLEYWDGADWFEASMSEVTTDSA